MSRPPTCRLTPAEWIADDRALTAAVENALAVELGLAPGELLLDYPAKTQMLGLDLLVQRPYGEVRRLTAAGLGGRDQSAEAVGGVLSIGALAARVHVVANRGGSGCGHRARAVPTGRAEVRQRVAAGESFALERMRAQLRRSLCR